MTRLHSMLLWTLAGCLAMAPVRARAGEFLAFDLPMERFDSQHVSTQQDKRQQVLIIEFFPVGETINTWTELITLQSLGKKYHPAPRAAVDATRQKLLERCPNLIWNEIEAKGEDITYEWRIEGCASDPDQHEISRYVGTRASVFRLAYTVKGKQMSPEVRAQWLDRLRAAHLAK